MHRRSVILLAATMLVGCDGKMPDWFSRRSGGAAPPVSVPKTHAPQTQPAATPAAPTPTATPAAPVAAPAAPTPAPAAPPTADDLGPDLAPKAKPGPARADDGRAVMAYVNDKPIYMDMFVDMLILGYGTSVSEQLVANEVVRQDAASKSVTITEAEAEAEHQRTLKSMFGQVNSADQRERLLDELLQRNHVSRKQWELTMRRNALLAKLAEKDLTITEAELQEEFGRQHEQKVEVLHIQTASLADAQTVLRELASGADFALVPKYSTGPSVKTAGLLAPFGTKDAGVPPALRQAALAMKKVGEVSDPIQVGTAFHVIKLIRIIPPKDVKFADVKDRLFESVRARKIQALQQDILQILVRGARVRYINSTLKTRVEGGSGS